jgi:hypothetical protein
VLNTDCKPLLYALQGHSGVQCHYILRLNAPTAENCSVWVADYRKGSSCVCFNRWQHWWRCRSKILSLMILCCFLCSRVLFQIRTSYLNFMTKMAGFSKRQSSGKKPRNLLSVTRGAFAFWFPCYGLLELALRKSFDYSLWPNKLSAEMAGATRSIARSGV